MSLNWGARAPTSCHYVVYLKRLFTTHMTAVYSSSLSSHSLPSMPSEPVTTHIYGEQWAGKGGRGCWLL